MGCNASYTWFRNVSLDLHPLVGGYGLLWLGRVVPIGVQVVVGAPWTPQLGKVVGVEPVLTGVAHGPLQVGVEGGGGGLTQGTLRMVTHLTCRTDQSITWKKLVQVK